MDLPGTILIDALVGSQAYGLATADSDEDRLGVFIAPTDDIVGLNWNQHRETKVGKTAKGDVAYHELGKALNLWLACNPTLIELLWLDPVNSALYHNRCTDVEHWQAQLRDIRGSFLHTQGVRDAYGGYARQQALKLDKRHHSFESSTRNRTAKHARHCMRLLLQGKQLLRTGDLTVKVANDQRDWLFEMGELAESNVDKFMLQWRIEDSIFMAAAEMSVLPEHPDKRAANAFLVEVRKESWKPLEV